MISISLYQMGCETFQMQMSAVQKELVELVPRTLKYFGSHYLIQFEVINYTFAKISNETGVKAEFHLRRMYTFHLANTYFPTTCLMIIVETTLFIDDSNFATNVMVSLTTLLVMYTLFQSISDNLPKTAYLKLIDMWLLFSLILPFIIFITHIVWELEKTKRNKEIALKRPNSFLEIQRPNNEPGLKQVKLAVQIIIPLATILFIVGYWSFALNVYY